MSYSFLWCGLRVRDVRSLMQLFRPQALVIHNLRELIAAVWGDA